MILECHECGTEFARGDSLEEEFELAAIEGVAPDEDLIHSSQDSSLCRRCVSFLGF